MFDSRMFPAQLLKTRVTSRSTPTKVSTELWISESCPAHLVPAQTSRVCSDNTHVISHSMDWSSPTASGWVLLLLSPAVMFPPAKDFFRAAAPACADSPPTKPAQSDTFPSARLRPATLQAVRRLQSQLAAISCSF